MKNCNSLAVLIMLVLPACSAPATVVDPAVDEPVVTTVVGNPGLLIRGEEPIDKPIRSSKNL